MHGTTDDLAPRKCLFPPIPELQDAVALLDRAANALLAGQFNHARNLLRLADMPIVHAYASRIMGRVDREIHRYRPVDSIAATSSPANRAVQRMPSPSVEKAIYQRDGYRCRFCGCPVVLGTARGAMRALVPEVIPWGKRSKDMHGAFFALTATPDHLVPHARGGGNDADNLLTTCWPCNFGRGDALIEEIGLLDPRSRAPIIDEWDGLSRMLTHEAKNFAFKRQAAKGSMPDGNSSAIVGVRPQPVAETSSYQAWFDELNRFHENAPARLTAFLEQCRKLQVSWKLNKVLIIYIQAENAPLDVFGIDPSGCVDVPWYIGPYKNQFRAFAEAIARAIPGAIAYETPKMWCVRKAGRKLTVLELLDVASEIKSAFKELSVALTG